MATRCSCCARRTQTLTKVASCSYFMQCSLAPCILQGLSNSDVQVLATNFLGALLWPGLASLPELPKVGKAGEDKEFCSVSIIRQDSAEQDTELLVASLGNRGQDKVGRSANNNTAAMPKQESWRPPRC